MGIVTKQMKKRGIYIVTGHLQLHANSELVTETFLIAI